MLGERTGSSRAKMTGMFTKVTNAVSIPKELWLLKRLKITLYDSQSACPI